MIITIPELAPTTNSSFKVGRGRFYQTEAYKDFKLLVWSLSKPDPMVGEVSVQVDVYVSRDRDIDNLKCLLDALQGIAYEDDAQIVELVVTKNKVKKGEECTVVQIDNLIPT